MFNEAWSVAFNVKFDELNQADHIQQTALGQYNSNTWRQFGADDPWADNVWLLCRTVGGISLNWPRYCSPERDKLLLDAQAETDQAKRVELYKQVVQNMHDAYTYVFLTHTIWANSFVNNVHGACDHKSPEGVALKCASNGRTWFDSVWMDS
jgi:ABC-type transport system substrate-binding protein